MKLRFDYNNMMADVIGDRGIDAGKLGENAGKIGAAFEDVLANCGKGWQEYAPYDKIIASAGATKLPQSLVEQLKEGGILVLPLNNHLMKYKKEKGILIEEKGMSCSFVDFVGS